MADDFKTFTPSICHEFGQNLKSMTDYQVTLEKLLSTYTELQNYARKFVVPFPADWAVWYYPKKLITSGWSLNRSIIPEQGPFMFALMLMKMLSQTVNLFLMNYSHLPLEVLWQQNPNHTKHP